MIPHPLEAYRRRRGWLQAPAAVHFGLSYGRFRQVVSGHSGASFRIAQEWAGRSGGEFSAMDVLLWHLQKRGSRQRAAG